MPLPPNPYPLSSRAFARVRISESDHAYLHSLFPSGKGVTDIIFSNLFHAFITELRARIPNVCDDDKSWHPDHRTNHVVGDILARVAFGNPLREASARHDERGTSDLHQGMCCAPEQCPDTPGSPSQGGHSPGRGENPTQESEADGQRGGGDGVAGLTDEGLERLFAHLRKI